MAVNYCAPHSAPLTRGNDYLITPAVGSPLYGRRAVKRASHRLMTCPSQLAGVSVPCNDLVILYQRKDVGVAVLKACPVRPPIRRCSHNRPPLGSSALGMSKSYIGIKTPSWLIGSLHQAAKTRRLITSKEQRIIDSGWMVAQRNGRIQTEVQNASRKAPAEIML